MGSVPFNSDPILWLQNRSLRTEAVGCKAAILSDFQSAGLAVPPGFILSPQYFQAFLQGVTWPVAGPAYPARQLWQSAEGLQQQVDGLAFPPQWERSLRGAYEDLRDRFPNRLYILRPSLGSIPTTGLLDPILHSLGTADPGRLWLRFCEDLRSLYRQCFQARSLLYWHYHHHSLAHLPLAVLVQPLLPAVATGTIEICPQEMRVSATWGMGAGLMQGESVPDRYVWRRAEWATLQLGRQSWVYWHPETPVAVNCPVEVLSPGMRSALTLQRVIPEAKHQPVLTPDQLAMLREEALALLSLFADLGSLEWIFSPSPSNPAHLDLVWTQGTAAAPLDQSFKTSGNDRFSISNQPISHQPVSNQPDTFIQGQGASKGVQVGRVYGMDASLPSQGLNLETLTPAVWNGNHASRESAPIILVAQQLTPEVFPWLTQVQGLVLAEGGMTSHGAILARELEIPAVVGVGLANLHYLLSQSWLRVDGTLGRVEVLVVSGVVVSGGVESGEVVSEGVGSGGVVSGGVVSGGVVSEEVVSGGVGSEGVGSGGVGSGEVVSGEVVSEGVGSAEVVSGGELLDILSGIRIFATINQVTSLGAFPAYPVEGVGLLRSEWFCLDLWEGHHPQHWITEGRQGELQRRLLDRLQGCIQMIQPRSLFYRSLDCRAAELQSLVGQGVFPWTVGGTFAHCRDPRVLDLEFAVLHQLDRCGSPLNLVLPMVRTVAEFIFCRDRYRQFLEEQGSPEPLSLWVMVEVPSLLWQLPALAEAGVQGLIIGPGDLAHSLLGLDRGRSGGLVEEVYHPLVHQVILNLVQQANQLQLPTLLCCHTETLAPPYLATYKQAGLWGITAEVPHLRAWALQLSSQPAAQPV